MVVVGECGIDLVVCFGYVGVEYILVYDIVVVIVLCLFGWVEVVVNYIVFL